MPLGLAKQNFLRIFTASSHLPCILILCFTFFSFYRAICIDLRSCTAHILIDDGGNGVLVKPDDPEALAAALDKLVRDPELRSRLGDAADDKVRGHFDYLVSVRQLMGLFAGTGKPTEP